MPSMRFWLKNEAVTIVAAVALLLHTLLPFYATYQMPTSSNAKQISSLFGDKVLLCTAEGFKLVSWKDLLSGTEHPKPHKQYQCPLCYVAAHGQGIKPDYANFITFPLPIRQHLFLFALNTDRFLSETHWRKLRTRSPPLSLVA